MNRNILTEINGYYNEVENGSAQGYDKIPYDVLKFPAVIVTLQQLFQLEAKINNTPDFKGSKCRLQSSIPLPRYQPSVMHKQTIYGLLEYQSDVTAGAKRNVSR